MENYSKLFALAAFLCMGSKVDAQQIVKEDDISISVLKWFYDAYPKSTTSVWEISNESGSDYYLVNFTFQGNDYKAKIDSKGRRVFELQSVEHAPLSVTNFLYDRFDQFKVKNISKKTSFPSESVSYVVRVKSKKEGLQDIEIEEESLQVLNQIAVIEN